MLVVAHAPKGCSIGLINTGGVDQIGHDRAQRRINGGRDSVVGLRRQVHRIIAREKIAFAYPPRMVMRGRIAKA